MLEADECDQESQVRMKIWKNGVFIISVLNRFKLSHQLSSSCPSSDCWYTYMIFASSTSSKERSLYAFV